MARMKAPLVKTKIVLVTGCSSGIGLATARMLRDCGWRVLPTARKPEDLEKLRTEGFEAFQLDMADASSVADTAMEILRTLRGQIGALVNNAGFGQPGAMEDLSRDTMRYQFEVNLFGLQELTNHFIPVFRRQGFGRIVNVSSCLGRVTLPMMGIYAASKFALEAASDALRIELRGSGVAVSIIEPGPIATEFRPNATASAVARISGEGSYFADYYRRQLADGTAKKASHLFMAKPEAVAKKIVHAVESPRPSRRYCVTFPAHALAFLRRFAPDGLMDLMLSGRVG